MRMYFIAILFTAVLCSAASLQLAAAADSDLLWVYVPVNFQVDKDTDRLLELLSRAKKAGYNGAVITDYKFGRIDQRPDNYYRNLKRTRAAAETLGIELIPLAMQVGYSNSILQNNPNLAAGLPVRDCEFIAQGDEARPASENNLLAGILVWSDMFDPHHNAHDNYYLVRGTLAQSWMGLEKSVTIINWNSGHAKESLAFFADRGHRQIIAGYYDENAAENRQRWQQAARGVQAVEGFMYTTWRQNYDQLEAFAK